MFKRILGWFRRRSKKPEVRIELPRGRRILSPGVTNQSEDEPLYSYPGYPQSGGGGIDYAQVGDLGNVDYRQAQGQETTSDDEDIGKVRREFEKTDFDEDSDSEIRNPYG